MSNSVVSYNPITEVSQLREKVRALLPYGKNLTPNEAESLARASVYYGLDPFNGEIWYLKNERTGESRGIQVGIKGLRKKARKQIEQGNFWATFRQIIDATERKQLQIPEGAMAFECRLFDSETLTVYTNTVKSLRETGMPFEQIITITGGQPYTSGIGVFKQGELTRMLPSECCMKRAEAAAMKRRFDVEIEVNVDAEPMAHDPDIIDGIVIEVADAAKDMADLWGKPTNGEAPRAEAKTVSEPEPQAAFEIDDAPVVTNPNQLLIEANRRTNNHYKNIFQVKNALGIKDFDPTKWQQYLSALVDRVNTEQAA